MRWSSRPGEQLAESERRAVRELLDGARAGRGGGLVVSGAPGSGASTLLAEAERDAAELGMRVLRSSGIEAEATIPYAALELMFRQHSALLAELPEAQRGALEVAFGLASGPAPEALPTGLGVLGLLARLAAERPLLVVVDDAHWLDRPSTEALGIAVRRLGAEPVAVLATEHAVEIPLGVPELRLGFSDVLTAEAALDAGDLETAQAAAARAGGANPRLARVRAAVHFLRGSYPTAHQVLIDAAAQAEPPLAARLLLQDLHIAWYLGEDALRHSARALAELRLPEQDPVAPLVGYALPALRIAVGEEAKLPPIRESVLEALRLGADLPRDLVQLCGLTLAMGDDVTAHEFAAELDAAAREKGLAGLRPTIRFFLAEAELFHDRYEDARAHTEAALALAAETGQHQWAGQLDGVLAYLAAVRGDADCCRTHAERALRASGEDNPTSAGGGWAQWALGLLDLGEGRAEDAVSRLEPLTTGARRHTVAALRAVPDLVEAAVRTGAPERAAGPLARFGRWAAATDQRWADALVRRCRALLAPDELAEDEHRAALAASAEERPFEQARTALLYGEWLRRARRAAEARGQLRQAAEVFDRLGAPRWAARARAELDAAAGARAPGRTAALTPQELQIVRLAAQGLSNRDIAARLFLSPRTVGYHLYKAYPKLGVASRAELPRVVD
jgi:DNA-binding CsgD family transcriptional regulator